MASLHFHREGSGEPLVLIHGIGGEHCVWEPVLEPLARRYDVIAVDLPGFGRSRPMPDGMTPTPAALAEAVAGLLDELGVVTAHAAGNSLGGWVALELAVAGRANSVTGLCPAGLWGAPLAGADTMQRGRGQRIARRLRPLIPVLMLSRRLRELTLSPFVSHPERVPYRAAWRMVRSYGRATAYDATSVAMRQDFFRGTEALHVPVTLGFGERDRLIRPTRLRRPGAESVIMRDCGHIPMWDDPGLVTSLIERTAARARPGRVPAAVT